MRISTSEITLVAIVFSYYLLPITYFLLLIFLFLLSFFWELLPEEIADALETVEFVGVMMIYEGVCLTVAFGALREAVEAVVFVDITYLLLCILLYGLVGLR